MIPGGSRMIFSITDRRAILEHIHEELQHTILPESTKYALRALIPLWCSSSHSVFHIFLPPGRRRDLDHLTCDE